MSDQLLLAVFAIMVVLSAMLLVLLVKTRRILASAFRIEATLLDAMRDMGANQDLRNNLVRDLKIESQHLYRQIQAYQDLVRLLRAEQPLPPLRGWAASPDFLLEIVRHALAHWPRVILECGSGATTVALARCCEINGEGRVLSLEHDPTFAKRTQREIDEHGLSQWTTVIDAPLIEHAHLDGRPWYALDDLDLAPGTIELMVVDGPPAPTGPLARFPALPLLMDLLALRCTVYLDDADRPDEKATVERWIEAFPDFVAEDLALEKGCAKLSRVARTS